MKTLALVQARMGSARLPGKMMLDLCGHPVLYWVLCRLKRAARLTAIVLATTELNRDDPLVKVAQDLELQVFRGSEADVLGRFDQAARLFGGETIVRVCADNPLISPEEIDRLVEFYLTQLDGGASPERLYAFNHITTSTNKYPDGLGAEILSGLLLGKLAKLAVQPGHREHVTTYLWDHPEDFDLCPVIAPADIAYPEVKLDVDTPEDLEKLRKLCLHLSLKSSPLEIIQAYRENLG